MPKDTQSQKEQIKVTDRRIFTADGEIREEFRAEIHPSETKPSVLSAEGGKEVQQQPESAAPEASAMRQEERPEASDHGRTVAGTAESPDTAFSEFIEGFIAQAYMFLGMLPHPSQPAGKLEPAAARQMIDIITLLQQKTRGNLTPDEEAFLTTHLGQLKLAFVQRTKSIQ